MSLFGLEILGVAFLFYSLKHLCFTKNNNINDNSDYQPPPRYENISNTGDIYEDSPPSYNEL